MRCRYGALSLAFVIGGLTAALPPSFAADTKAERSAEGQPKKSAASANKPDKAVWENFEALETALRFAEAEAEARRLLAGYETRYGADSVEVAYVLDYLVRALYHQSRGAAPETRQFAERALAIKEKRLGPEHEQVGYTCAILAQVMGEAGDLPAQEQLLKRSLAIREKTWGPESRQVAYTLVNLASLFNDTQRLQEQRRTIERAVAILEKLPPPPDSALRAARNSLAIALARTGEPEAAASVMQRAVEGAEAAFGPDHPEVAHALYGQADLLLKLGKSAESRAAAERALRILEVQFDPSNDLVLDVKRALANAMRATGDAKAAKPLLQEVLALREKALGPENPYVLQARIDLARTLSQLGEHEDAKSQFETCLTTVKKLNGPESIWAAQGLGAVATVDIQLGDYAAARQAFEQSLAIEEKVLGPEHPNLAAPLNNLGNLLLNEGDFAGAIPYLLRALAIGEKSQQYGPHSLGPVLFNLGAAYTNLFDFEQARTYLERALQVSCGADAGPSGDCLSPAHLVLGWLLSETGEYDRAQELLQWTLSKYKETFGEESHEYATTLSGLGRLHSLKGDHDAAIAMIGRALEIDMKGRGRDHPDVANLLNSLAESRMAARDAEGALAAALQSGSIGLAHLRLTAEGLSEREALSYASLSMSSLDMALSAAVSTGSARNSRAAWDAVVRSRAAVLDEMSARNAVVFQNNDEELAALAGRVGSARNRLARLVVRGPQGNAREDHDATLEQARLDKESAERELGRHSTVFRELMHEQRLGLDEVVAALPPGAALVAFARYEHFDPGRAYPSIQEVTGLPSYLAFVLGGDRREPAIVALGSAPEIDALVARVGAQVAQEAAAPGRSTKRSEAAYRAAAAALRARVWDPVVAHLGKADRVFIVPDGALNVVNFTALPTGRSKYLVETGPLLHELSTERDLARTHADAPRGGLLALGAPAFEETSLFAALAPEPKPEPPTQVAQAGGGPVFRGQRSACGDFSSLRFDPLPGSGAELRELSSLWNEVDHVGAGAATVLTGAGASETALKRSAAGQRVLHLATHAYFVGGACPSFGGAAPTRSGAPPAIPPLKENPLLLSGLALAGANHRDAAGAEEDDGVLTAEEAASLDLGATEWAVLSGCDTGLGEVRAGEGLFGLRRAFQVAGARTVISSLWPVEDETARSWMTKLYTHRFKDSLGTAEAVRAASLDILKDRRKKGLGGHPFQWAAFVAVGDWR